MDNSHETVDFEEGEATEPLVIKNSGPIPDPISSDGVIENSTTMDTWLPSKRSRSRNRDYLSVRPAHGRPRPEASSPPRTGFLDGPKKKVDSGTASSVKLSIPGLCLREVSLPMEKDHLPHSFKFIKTCFGGDNYIRGFIARCNYYDIFAKAKHTCIWRAPEYIIERIDRAHAAHKGSVLLFFTVHQSKYFQGVAQISRKASIERPSASEKLYRVPLTWIYICDIPFYSIPHVPGMLERDDTVRDSFELPIDGINKLLVHFENTVRSIHFEKPGSLGN